MPFFLRCSGRGKGASFGTHVSFYNVLKKSLDAAGIFATISGLRDAGNFQRSIRLPYESSPFMIRMSNFRSEFAHKTKVELLAYTTAKSYTVNFLGIH